MNTQENSSGKPLADAKWLENHHNAKIKERMAFVNKLAYLNPKRIVDLGCASGLWFDLFDKMLPQECEFVGIDSDKEILKIATERSKTWKRKSVFIQMNIEENVSEIPVADLTLAFNVFPYINDLNFFIKKLSERIPKGTLAIRQYDGASIRFGPMSTSKRQQLEVSLRVATENSQKFHHYDMDRTFEAIHTSLYKNCSYGFELFERTSPFTNDFIPYYEEMLSWTCQHISETSAKYLQKWLDDDLKYTKSRYFYEVDLVAILS